MASRLGRKPSAPRTSVAVAVSVLGALAGLLMVWRVRETAMLAKDVGLLVPFVFPPLAVVAEVVAATVACLPVLLTAPPTISGGEGAFALMG